jgi:anti-sigma B factor antagonist
MSSQPPGELDMDVERRGPAAVVRVRGSAGMEEADQFRRRLEQLAEQPFAIIALDLGQLEFISSAGLGALISAHKKARPHEGRIRLVNPQPMILRVLETTRLTSVFEVFGTLEEALAS